MLLFAYHSEGFVMTKRIIQSTAMVLALAGSLMGSLLVSVAHANPAERQALFGETHVHTTFSFDAYIFGNRNDPDAAYRFAKGEAVDHPSGFPMQLARPLDFQAVTDHAMYLGMVPAMFDTQTDVSKHPVATALREAETAIERRDAFQKMLPYIGRQVEDDLLDMGVVRSAWQEVIAAAERHNDPGKFTTFIGYEFTASQAQFENLHRNVLFRGSQVPDEPHSRLISLNPEDLWRWMDDLRAKGMDSIAIPHNSNGSDGYMFRTATYDGSPITTAYSQMRMRNEPLVEVSQIKGTSETHPLLSPNDEFSGFEIMPYQIATWRPSQPSGSYVREAYLNGLKLNQQGVGNPFKFGLIAASDSHVGAGSFDENNYWSKIGMVDSDGKLRGSVSLTWSERGLLMLAQIRSKFSNWNLPATIHPGDPGDNPAPGYRHMQWSTWGASGLAGVWAESNTRDSIFAAMRRKETFATSGPRLRVRFFAGTQYPQNMLTNPNMISDAYQKGVPMGGELKAGRASPDFLVWVTRDPASAPLQRVQVVKGWIENGDAKEQIYDVACAGDQKVDAITHRCPDNNAKVDMSDCSISADNGADELKAVWRDPDFKPEHDAFYYVRGIENPTCRWSSWDAIRAGTPPNPALEATIQERVWSSPIWIDGRS